MTSTPHNYALIPLRPLSVGDLFTATFAIYKQNFGQFVLLGLLPTVAGVAVGITVAVVALVVGIPWVLSMTGLESGAAQFGVGVAGLGVIGLLLVAGWVLSVVAWHVSAGMTSLGVVQVNRGQLPTVRSLWRDTRGLPGRSLGLFGLALAAGVVLLGLVGLFIVLAIGAEAWWLMLVPVVAIIVLSVLAQARLGLVLQVLGIEGRGAIDTVRNCWRLTAGSGPRIFGTLFLAQFLVNAALQVVSSAAVAVSGSLDPLLAGADSYQDLVRALGVVAPRLVLGNVLTVLAGIVATPFMWIFGSVLYVDQLRRKQALAGQPLFP